LDRKKEIIHYRLRFLDELDTAEAEEREEADRMQARATAVPLPSDEVPLDPSFLSDSF
jgi:hypothetical protein